MADFIEFAIEIFPTLLEASKLSLILAAICLSIGLILGLGLALARVYGNKILYFFATGYIELIRGTPILVQLFIIYYGLPDLGLVFSPLVAASIAFSMNTSAYQAEYFRGAILAIKRNQLIAAQAIGMSKLQGICNIILPQMARTVIPPWSNEAILMFKVTSLAFIVGVPEIMARADEIGFRSFKYFEVYVVTALIYIGYVFIFTKILDFVEKRIYIPGLEIKGRKAV